MVSGLKNRMQQYSPNDISAHLYDIVNSKIKPAELLDNEIEIIEREISKLKNSNIKILDVGAGTGRHAIKLVELGYDVTAVEASKEMVAEMKKKLSKISTLNFEKLKYGSFEVINSSIFEYEPEQKFDLIMLFWNTWNEIALNDKLAENLIQKLNHLLNKDGIIILNMDDPAQVDFEHLHFETEVKVREGNIARNLMQKWQTIHWYKDLKKSVALEEIFEVVPDDKHQDKQNYKLLTSTKIEQRWYSFEEIKVLFSPKNMNVERISVNFSGEMYILLKNIL